jgi:thioredoxin-like negative regulator of GroEL
LCERFYSPYPDLVSGRTRTGANSVFLDAMAHYSQKDYPAAIEGLQRVLERNAGDMTARLYMASAQLAAGDPYKAEMHLDFMENSRGADYKDQVEWYNALCWLCEGDTAKAAQQARWIASRPQTYRKQARELADALSNK